MGAGPVPSLAVSILVIQNDVSDPIGLAGDWLAGFDLITVSAGQGQPVPDRVPGAVHGVILLGGSMGALDDDRAPWLPNERALVRDAIDRGVPILGLCLGHQILAAATGGRIALADHPEVGLVSVTRTDAGKRDPVIAALPDDVVQAVHYHHDEVTQLPANAELLLTNESCRVQGFRIGEMSYGLQMHPEIDGDTFATWAANDDGTIAMIDIDVEETVAAVHAAQEALQRTWRPVIEGWATLVRS